MADFEEETYSTVFASLRHPLRRKILRTLSVGPQSFTDLQRVSGIESPHLTYHLEGLGNLLVKTGDGKYALSTLGKTAFSMMKLVEEPPCIIPLHVSFSPKKWKLLVVALTMGIIVLSTVFYFEYQSLILPSNQYSSLIDKYIVSGSVKTSLAKNETSGLNHVTSAFIPLGHTKVYSFNSLADNSTLEIEIQLLDSIGQGAHVSLAVYAETTHPCIANVGTLDKSSEPWSFNASREVVEWAYSYEKIWDTSATIHSKYSVSLPSDGWYYVLIEGPAEWDATEYHTIVYTLTLQIQYQGYYVPFSIGNEQEGWDWLPMS